MLKLFEKLEILFNKSFEKFVVLIASLLRSILPRRFFYKIEDYHYFVVYRWARFKENSKKKTLQFLADAHVKKNEIFHKIKEAQQYPFKEILNEKIKDIKFFLKTTTFQEYIEFLKQFFHFILQKMKDVTDRFSAKMIKVSILTTVIVILAVNAIINQGQNIWSLENPYREPAKVEDFADKASYYNRPAKTMIIRNVRIPIFVENVREIRSVTMEFSVRTSTRFAKIYLEEKEHLVRDHLFMNMEPIISTFPIEEEGKRILTEKIQDELNFLLQQEKVEGVVEMVRVLYIIGS